MIVLALAFLLFSSSVNSELSRKVGLRELSKLRSTPKYGGRIVGGAPATDSYAYLAAIYQRTAVGQYFCGGTIVSESYVLTAGQCVQDAVEFTIQVGSRGLNAPEATLLAAEDYIAHPDFDFATLNNDIALIRLRFALQFTDFIAAVHQLPAADYGRGAGLVIVGWGQTSDNNDNLADWLNWGRVIAITNQECAGFYTDGIEENVLCVEGNWNEGLCYGDMGSPLLALGIGPTTIAGVASFMSSKGCLTLDPSGYTRVFPYNAWIRSYVPIA